MSQDDNTNDDTPTRRTGDPMPWSDWEPIARAVRMSSELRERAGVQVLGQSERTIDQAHQIDLELLEAKFRQLDDRLRVLEVWALAADLFHKDPS